MTKSTSERRDYHKNYQEVNKVKIAAREKEIRETEEYKAERKAALVLRADERKALKDIKTAILRAEKAKKIKATRLVDLYRGRRYDDDDAE